jgi:ubiquinone/menaquinone biosynthesis C-methylase UbiE
MNNPANLAVQYANDHDLQVRIATHMKYTVGANLEIMVDQALELLGDETLLDVGTGPGDFPARVQAAGHRGEIIGMDYSQGMVDKARASHSGVTYVQGDVCALPFATSSFDVVTARHMLYHVPDLEQALRECKRVLKPGGRFLALTNADGNMQEFWDAVMVGLEDDPAFAAMNNLKTGGHAYHHAELAQSVRDCFGNAELSLSDGALVFPDASGPIAYFDSCRTAYGISESDWARGRVAVQREFEQRCEHGPWRVSKQVAIITARA